MLTVEGLARWTLGIESVSIANWVLGWCRSQSGCIKPNSPSQRIRGPNVAVTRGGPNSPGGLPCRLGILSYVDTPGCEQGRPGGPRALHTQEK